VNHFRTRVQLFAETAVVGMVLSLTVPLFYRVMGWHSGDENLLDLRSSLFFIGIGLPCSVLFALVFGDFILACRRVEDLP
jgi:hypothetical protein